MIEVKPPITVSMNEWVIIQNILEKHIPKIEVWAFGSRVKGLVKSYSDLDTVIMGEEALSISTLADLKKAFSDSDLPFKVDLILWSETSENFRRLIKNSYAVIKLGRPL